MRWNMRPELIVAVIVAVIAAVAAVSAAVITYRGSIKTSENTKAIAQLESEDGRRKEEAQRRKEISNFSEPLARSAYDLQSRIFNILKQGLIEVYLVKGNERERSYVVNNTVFLVAQYLCWNELVRREIQFIDLGKNDKTRQLLRLQDDIYSVWGSDRQSPLFRIFAGEQRAIGEALVQNGARGLECMGYGAFLATFASKSNPLIEALKADVRALSTDLADASARLRLIQHALIDLLKMLDPDYLRFPEDRRSKVQ